MWVGDLIIVSYEVQCQKDQEQLQIMKLNKCKYM